jgi:hypothetical protein
MNRVVEIHPWQQLIFTAVSTQQLALTFPKTRRLRPMVASLQVVALSFIVCAELHRKPKFDLVELGWPGTIRDAVDADAEEEKGINPVNLGITAQEHIGFSASNQLIAVLLAAFEDVLGLTYIAPAIDTVHDAVKTSTVREKVNSVHFGLHKYGVIGGIHGNQS